MAIWLCGHVAMFQNFQNFDSQDSKDDFFQNDPRFFLDFLIFLVSPKINHVGFGAWLRVQKPRNHENAVSGLSNNEIVILLYQSEAEKINKAIESIM